MTILAIRTDSPTAAIYVYDGNKKLSEIEWEAHRKLANTIHEKIKRILDLLSISIKSVDGVVVFYGPGSFTGLRIGHSVANALAYAQNIPIVARGGENWLEVGITDLLTGKNDKITAPEYGSPPNTTSPKK